MTETYKENQPIPSDDPWGDLAAAAQQYEQYVELAQLGVLAAQAAVQQVAEPAEPAPLSLVLWEQQ